MKKLYVYEKQTKRNPQSLKEIKFKEELLKGSISDSKSLNYALNEINKNYLKERHEKPPNALEFIEKKDKQNHEWVRQSEEIISKNSEAFMENIIDEFESAHDDKEGMLTKLKLLNLALSIKNNKEKKLDLAKLALSINNTGNNQLTNEQFTLIIKAHNFCLQSINDREEAMTLTEEVISLQVTDDSSKELINKLELQLKTYYP